MKKQKFIIVGSVVGHTRGSVIDLTEAQAKSGIWAGRVRPATVVTVGDPAKEQELTESLEQAGKHNTLLVAELHLAKKDAEQAKHKIDEDAKRLEALEAEVKAAKAEVSKLQAEHAEAIKRAEAAEAAAKDRDKPQLEIATPSAATGKK